MVSALAGCLGHPRVGVSRELKKALESYWAKKSSASRLLETARELRHRHWRLMHSAGIDHIPSNDFSLYDHMLDMAVLVGANPARYQSITDPLTRYFAMARGLQDHDAGIDVPALEMTKWFDTNYHYIVPELAAFQNFELSAGKMLAEIDEARALGIEPRPVVVGPVSFLMLCKLTPDALEKGMLTLDALEALLPVYTELLGALAEKGIAWVQLDEPCLVVELEQRARTAYRVALERLATCPNRPRILATTYFGALGDNLPLVLDAGLDGLHVDLVRAPEQLDAVLKTIGGNSVLSLGVVDGRNVWRTDLDKAHATVRQAVAKLGEQRVIVAPSCSLLHVPVDLGAETQLDPELRSWLAFAAQKLEELRALADMAASELPEAPLFEQSRQALERRRASPRSRNPDVRARVGAINQANLRRRAPYAARSAKQRTRLGLPLLPTTTIGSFPQTPEVRSARAAWRAGRLTDSDYTAFLEQETRRCLERQEALGIDVLVHGEFERNDMVEYFGEQLEGFAFTKNGWVQSYGSRCVKPPILFGDVTRPQPISVKWSHFAQAQTARPVKGMLTGPVTMLQWSFVRDDQPRSETCMQLALALRDEVADLEAANIAVIQVDEPAIREGLPLCKRDHRAYLRWAVDAFKLSTAGVRDETQIHTHMCYSEFGDILEAVAEMDADVLSIETSRSKMELFVDFGRFHYQNEVGPGVYDIHSPRVPSRDEMLQLLIRAAKVLPVERLWVNPDCGLKTRAWPEVETALGNMVEAARLARKQLANTAQ